MTLHGERNLWRVIGYVALLAGVAAMVGAFVMLYTGDDLIDKTPSRIQAFGDAVALCGVAALVLARLIGVVTGREQQPSLLWAGVCYGSILLGAAIGLIQGFLWMNATRTGAQVEGFSSWQKAVILLAGFLLMSGVISFVGDRATLVYFKSKRSRSAVGGTGR